ncbi:MAG: hypothetical protein JSS66_02795 [Armatimonadetes bacterium]|nr:hypothetical protein [Armatimonadota bacterium]
MTDEERMVAVARVLFAKGQSEALRLHLQCRPEPTEEADSMVISAPRGAKLALGRSGSAQGEILAAIEQAAHVDPERVRFIYLPSAFAVEEQPWAKQAREELGL